MSQLVTTPRTPESAIAAVPTGLFINGSWRDGANGTIDIENPSDGKIVASVADAGLADINAAVEAAVQAQDAWAITTSRFRSDLLLRAYDAIVDQREVFAAVIATEMGKTLAEARGEVDYSVDFLKWFSEEAPRLGGRYSMAPSGNSRLLTTVAPVGPCLLITPWNFPLAMAARKIAPAIAAGCTSILKPASLTPLTSMLFAHVLSEVGLPAGVLNVITSSKSSQVSQTVLADRRVRKVSFTGSTEVGRGLLRLAAQNVQRTSMELGGNAPFLIFDDADLRKAVDGAVLAKMRNNGQSCIAANRLYVQQGIEKEFTDLLVDRLNSLTVGNVADTVDVGPLVDERQRRSVESIVDSAVAGGATLRAGGSRIDVNGAGYYYAPTVLTDVPPGSPALRNEIFGPVAPIVTFRDEDEAFRLANDTEFGLAGYVYTENLNRALRALEKLQVGMVGINQGIVSNAAAPFGGVKASGLGREGGSEGITEYTDIHYAAISH